MAGIRYYNVSNQTMPPNCVAKAIGYIARLQLSTSDTLDLTNEIIQNHISQLQGVYIDNSANAQTVTIQVQGTQQKVSIGANRQAYLPLLIPPGQEAFTFTSTGGVLVPLFFLNVPMPTAVWAAV